MSLSNGDKNPDYLSQQEILERVSHTANIEIQERPKTRQELELEENQKEFVAFLNQPLEELDDELVGDSTNEDPAWINWKKENLSDEFSLEEAITANLEQEEGLDPVEDPWAEDP